MADLETVTETAAQAPQTTVVDGTTVTRHSLKELTDLANRKAAKTGATKNHRGIRFTKLNPPGTT